MHSLITHFTLSLGAVVTLFSLLFNFYIWRVQSLSKEQECIKALRSELNKTKELKYKNLLGIKLELLRFKFIVGYIEKKIEVIKFYHDKRHTLSPKEFKYLRNFLKFKNGVFSGLDIRFIGLSLSLAIVMIYQFYSLLEILLKKSEYLQLFFACLLMLYVFCALGIYIHTVWKAFKKIKFLAKIKHEAFPNEYDDLIT